MGKKNQTTNNSIEQQLLDAAPLPKPEPPSGVSAFTGISSVKTGGSPKQSLEEVLAGMDKNTEKV